MRPDGTEQVIAMRDHLRAIYGADGGDVPGWLVVFALPSRRSLWIRGDTLFSDSTAECCVTLAAREHVYFGLPSTRACSGAWNEATGRLQIAGTPHLESSLAYAAGMSAGKVLDVLDLHSRDRVRTRLHV